VEVLYPKVPNDFPKKEEKSSCERGQAFPFSLNLHEIGQIPDITSLLAQNLFHIPL
jgi:hypothetical protein